ncbi:porin [Vogesella facilis]|uniref:Porin n=1 Tax=Vogesella facilis TaxID=1655232 RepID=A0ABV7RE06_9NEIS
MKKLIVLATLAALPAVAMADVTISGNLAVGIVNTKASGSGSLTTEDRTSGEIKFAGSDDLGNGLKGIWQIASRINLADTADGNTFAGRDSYVGLEGGFGRLTLGNIYLMPTSGAMAIFENDSATWKSSIYDQGDRYNNTVSYKTPSFSGFTATVQHSFGSGTTSSVDDTTREADKLYSQAISLAYEGDGWTVSYDASRSKLDTLGTTSDTKYKTLHELNASVTLSDLTLMAGYARGVNNFPSDDDGEGTVTAPTVDHVKRSGWGLAASYALGNFTPKIGFWKEGDAKADGENANDGHKTWAVGVEYALSKRTRAGVELVKVNYDDNATADLREATIYLGTKF